MQDRLQYFLNNRKLNFCCIEISSSCILRCKACFIWKNKYRKSLKIPTLAEWYNFIDSIPDLNKDQIVMNFSGAEPLSDDKNLILVNVSTKKGLSTSMCSNGFLIDKKMAYKIAQSGLKVIIISLDGIDKNTHDFLRGRYGCYNKVMQAIVCLNKYCHNLEVGVQTIILERNLNEIIKLTERVNEDKRIKFIHFQAVAQPFNTPFDNEWYKKSEYNMLWPQDIKNTHATIDELIRLKKIGYKISNSVSQLETFKRYFENPQGEIKKTKCNVDLWMNITQSGDIYICRLKKPIGNIKNGHLKDIWYSEEANRIREEIKNCRINCHLSVNCCYE